MEFDVHTIKRGLYGLADDSRGALLSRERHEARAAELHKELPPASLLPVVADGTALATAAGLEVVVVEPGHRPPPRAPRRVVIAGDRDLAIVRLRLLVAVARALLEADVGPKLFREADVWQLAVCLAIPAAQIPAVQGRLAEAYERLPRWLVDLRVGQAAESHIRHDSTTRTIGTGEPTDW